MKKNLFVKACSLLLVLAALFCMVPAAFAEGDSDAVAQLMDKFDSRVKAPKESSLLEKEEEMEVWSTYGRLIYVYDRPAEALDFKVGEAKEGVKVTVYARQNGFALAITEDGKTGGWMREDMLDTKVHGEHPSFLDIPPVVVEGTYVPARRYYLDEYETLYVKSTYGTRICLVDDPRRDPADQKVIGFAYEGEACAVLSRLCGKVFVITEKGRVGWAAESLMVENYS